MIERMKEEMLKERQTLIIYLFLFKKKGIGRDICERLYASGATVYAISRSSGPLNELKAACPNVITLQIDLADWTKTRTELTKLLKNIEIDGLVNNAGIAICKPITELTEKDFDE